MEKNNKYDKKEFGVEGWKKTYIPTRNALIFVSFTSYS